MESGVDLKSVNKGWGEALKSVMWSVGIGVVGAVSAERWDERRRGKPENGKRLNLYVL